MKVLLWERLTRLSISQSSLRALPSLPDSAHIRPMAKSPRHPSRPSKKDPAHPTRSKAPRPDAPPTDPALERLLNPGIEKGPAGMGSGTGLRLSMPSFRGASEASELGIQKQTRSKPLDFGSAPE